ncbi:MAG: PAS domain S-box protein [Burkholderiales bacterium]|nr:PAS domain S-box protein [Burkholderiales bacterium]
MILLNHRLSIRSQLLVLVLFVVLASVAFTAWHIADDARQAREAAYARVSLVADEIAKQLELTLRDHEVMLGLVAAEFRGNPPVRAPRFDPEQFVRNRPQLANLGVRDLQANNIYSHRPNPTPPEAALKFPWVAQGLRSESFAAGNAFLGTLSGRWVTVLTYPVRDAEGRRSGFVNLSLELLTLNRRAFASVPKNALVSVFDGEGRFLLRSADPESWIGKALGSAQAQAMQAVRAGTFTARGEDGVSRVYAGVMVPGAGWRVVAGLPESEVFADYRDTLMHSIAIGLAALLLVLAFARRISQAIARPIHELAGAVDKISRGEHEVRARVEGSTEIDQVAREFNRMLDALERQREERAALVRHIEKQFQLARDVILLIDPEGNIVQANNAAVAAYGYSADELQGMNIRSLRSEETLSEIERDWQSTAGKEGVLFETLHRRRDGSVFPVEVSGRTIDIEGRSYRQSLIRDISQRHAAEAKIRRLNTAYATLSATNEAIVRLHDASELFPRICRIAVEYGQFAGAWVGIVDEKTRQLVPAAFDGNIGDYLQRIRISTDSAQPEGRGPMALALRAGQAYYCQDFQADPATEPWQAQAAQFGIRSVAALPLRRAGAVIGTLNLYCAEPRIFDAETRALLEEMSADISFALDNFEREAARRQAEAQLSQSEARFRSIIETAHDAFILVGSRGELLDTNQASCELTGYGREELLKMSLRDLEAIETEEEIAKTTAQVIAAGHARFERAWRRKDGRVLNVEISTTHAGAERGGYFFSFVHNITERKQAEQALRDGEERFRGMLEQNVSAMFLLEDGVLTYVNQRAAEILGHRAAELIGKTMLDVVAEADQADVAEAMRQLLSGERKSAERSFGVRRKDGSLAELGAHASVATLQGKKVILGIAQDIGERKKAQLEINRYIERLEHSMESTLQAVSGMVELRDPYTAGHELRVGELAAAIGKEMGLPEAKIKGLRLTGYVHDIGKISVPAELLSKPGRLTPMEFELIKGHSQSGYEVLKDADFPWPVAKVILQHHERIDGSGYPGGLKDGEIILEARIMAVADVLEAMSSHRPYRPGLGLEAALDEIARNSGKSYDPQVAAACLRLFREKGYALPE